MSPWLARWLPPEPPLAPMAFTRQPVLLHFWASGLLGLVIGFGLGFWLWLQQTGVVPADETYGDGRLLHARVQILLFAGSFLMGFALQAGPHVVAGTPPEARTALRILPLLWLGFGVMPMVQGMGQGLVSLAFLWAGWLVLRMVLAGDRQRLAGIGLPLAAGFFFLALAAWLPLAENRFALAVLWCAPVTIIFAASQQLLANVMAGQRLTGWAAWIFLALLAGSWLLSLLAAWEPVWTTAMAWAWLAVWSWFMWHSQAWSAIPRQGFTSLAVTLAIGFLLVPVSAAVLLWQGAAGSDTAIHLLAAGSVTVLILGVAGRVASFFSAGRLFHDRLLALLLLAWTAVAVARALGESSALLWTLLGSGLLLAWAARFLARLLAIRQRIPQQFGGKGPNSPSVIHPRVDKR